LTYHIQHRQDSNSPWLNIGADYHESKQAEAIDKAAALGPNYRLIDSDKRQIWPKEKDANG
jgi:hypothetical protein